MNDTIILSNKFSSCYEEHDRFLGLLQREKALCILR